MNRLVTICLMCGALMAIAYVLPVAAQEKAPASLTPKRIDWVGSGMQARYHQIGEWLPAKSRQRVTRLLLPLARVMQADLKANKSTADIERDCKSVVQKAFPDATGAQINAVTFYALMEIASPDSAFRKRLQKTDANGIGSDNEMVMMNLQMLMQQRNQASQLYAGIQASLNDTMNSVIQNMK